MENRKNNKAVGETRRGVLKKMAAGAGVIAGASAFPGFVRYAQTQSSEPIRIGFQVHRTGIGASYGRWYDRTTQAAVSMTLRRTGAVRRRAQGE